MSSPIAHIAAALRLVPRWSPSVLDRWPTAVLLALGLLPALALGTAALRSPAATALVLLLLPGAVWWQGGRVRLAGVVPPPAPAPLKTPDPVASAVPKPQPVQDRLIAMVELPGGRFRMGSDKARDPQAYDDESPSREVCLAPFAMATTPVTRGFYYSLTKHRPREWRYDDIDDTLPATHVTWEDAVRFCNALSLASGRPACYRRTASGWDCDWTADGYRLPTEAQWEYACRAGTDTPWFWGAEEGQAGRYAWFSGNSDDRPHPVATKDPNPWGLYDLAGNCWEWCWDWYAPYDPQAVDDPRGAVSARRRVLRGGSFFLEPRRLRSAGRNRDSPEDRDERIGFRCVRGAGRQPVD